MSTPVTVVSRFFLSVGVAGKRGRSAAPARWSLCVAQLDALDALTTVDYLLRLQDMCARAHGSICRSSSLLNQAKPGARASNSSTPSCTQIGPHSVTRSPPWHTRGAHRDHPKLPVCAEEAQRFFNSEEQALSTKTFMWLCLLCMYRSQVPASMEPEDKAADLAADMRSTGLNHIAFDVGPAIEGDEGVDGLKGFLSELNRQVHGSTKSTTTPYFKTRPCRPAQRHCMYTHACPPQVHARASSNPLQ